MGKEFEQAFYIKKNKNTQMAKKKYEKMFSLSSN